jgi:colicin import membrane protein
MEVEKRRAELAALTRAVEARLKEAEEKCEQAEDRLERELRERLLAEQRLKELEENRLRQQTITIEAPQARTSTWAQGVAGAGIGAGTGAATKDATKELQAKAKESEAKIREAEARSKETEAEIQTLMVALMEAEQKRAKAEALAHAAADRARAIESEAETSRIALAEANRKLAEAEAAARVAEENARANESLIIEAEAAGRQATERYQHIEAELQYETKQRATAEQKLKEFEDELSSYLELDWSKGEPDLSRAAVVRPNGGADEVVSQFQAQIEAERRARREAEGARATLEHKAREMERALRIAEENNRQIAALNMTTSADDDQSYSIKKRKGFKHELKFIGYGVTIALLFMVLIAIVATFFLM